MHSIETRPRLALLPFVAGAWIALGTPVAANPPAAAGRVELTVLTDRVRIEIGGQLFSEYVFTGAKRPYLYPILAEDGTSLTRDFPMRSPPGEDHDHPHHRSLWFAHSRVNGIDFWNEAPAGGSTPKGTIEHSGLNETTSGAVGKIRATNVWRGPDGALVCTDETTICVQAVPGGRMLDYEVALLARPNEPLLVGDNKDGTMALRLAQWMTLPHNYLKQDLPGSGHFVTSTGLRDKEAWGKRADWCDATAPRGGKIYGVAIFDHPGNLRHPTWWMARDYGLFGANPFGQHDYENLTDNPHAGDFTVPAGGRLTLRYRFFLHDGDTEAAGVAARYAEYAAGR